MEVCAIRCGRDASDRSLIDQQHQLRARIFAGRLGWDVSVTAGSERDRYDDLDPTYILVLADSGVIGSARLLPAMGPTMLERTFPQLLTQGRLTAHATTVESSRFCVDTSLAGGRGGGLHQATLTLFAGIIEWSMAVGYQEIVTATDLRFERILNRAGWPLERLGEPCRIGSTTAIAGRLPADRASFDKVCPPGYRSTIREQHVPAMRAAA